MEATPSEPIQIQEAESTTTPPPAPEIPPTPDPVPSPPAAQPETDPPAEVPEPEVVPSPPQPKVYISINVKTPKEKQSIEVEEDANVKEIKKIVAEKFSADPDYICLIFAGKMLEESDTLSTHNISAGMTIHLIIKTAPREPQAGPIRPPADITQTPFGLGTIGGLIGLDSLGLGSSNFMELQNRMQTELLGNPELLRRVLENPLVQTLMNDADNMKSLIQTNPQMRDLMSRHPEIRSMLNNKELLQQTAELARNPSMLQELMRNLDGTNPMEGSTTNYTTLPVIYQQLQNQTGVTKKMQDAQKRTEIGGVFNNPQMSSMLQQMSDNPRMMESMMNAPYTQAMLQALQADPSMASAIVNENPLYKDNPQLQQYLTSMMPQLITQLQNPEVLNMMANPQAVNALLQIQEGLDNLKNHAPGLVAGLGLGSFNDFTGANVPGTSSDAPSPPPTASGGSFSKFMASMVAQMSNFDSSLPPEERYKIQLEHLKAMGFHDDDVNLQTLTAVFGDVNAAVQRLFALNGSKI